MIIFGNIIAMLRKEKGWSQTELSKKLSILVSVISRYERDDKISLIDAAKKMPGC